MTEIDVVWLVDLDPPSDLGGGKGFYPASDRVDPPEPALMRARCDAVFDLVTAEAGGKAVVTVHTSPRHRTALLEGMYPDIWRRFAEAGVALALHPHEERSDGSTHYDDAGHLQRVVTQTIARAAAAGFGFSAFRSGTFSFNPALPQMLMQAGIEVDLSAAPTLRDAHRSIDWPAASYAFDVFLRDGVAVVEVPIGWSGAGCDLGSDYLFSERTDLAGLVRVWDGIRRRADAAGAPPLVNFLCHGFGLVDEDWRRQAVAFIAHMRAHGGRVVGTETALARLDQPLRLGGEAT